jgi:predicted nucleic acid-binding protein
MDTNVLSELSKEKPDERVLEWFDQVDESHLYISVISLGEICHGLERLPEGKKKNDLILWFDRLQEAFRHKTWPVDDETALKWGELTAHRSRMGHPLSVPDGQIAATAHIRGAILITRNTKGFENLAIQTLNPWLP